MMATIDTWHNRLGHASTSKLSYVNFLKNVSLRPKDVCDSCIKAKFTRLPFPISTTKTNACFDLLHCDVWGKYRTLSFTRASYFLTIVDDFSRAVWVFLLKRKDEASTCLVFFHKMIQIQFGKNIKRIRCDNGGEFTSNRMLDFYTKEGIVFETTCPHTSQQNGVVERKHRHLLETARALKFEANLPTKFWGECILTATYIINRLPSDVIENKTPYEILYNRQPEYEHMRVFGCLAYYRNTETNGDKFEPRGRVGVFLGYPPGTKGYKVFDAQHNKIVVSRDVKFFGKVFPFAKVNIKEDNEKIFEFPKHWNDEQSNDEEIGPQPINKQMGPNEVTLGQQNQSTPEGEPLETESPSVNTLPAQTEHSSTESPESLDEPLSKNIGPLTEGPTPQEDGQNIFVDSEFIGPTSENVEQSKRTRSRPKHLNDYEV
ncbi:putative RNA-directed DNA polymerase [Helianthus debilis subsp. tardiflorus]